jgi:hypothetical protein
MEKQINKFLDEYLGDEIIVRKNPKPKNNEQYFICSKQNKITILWFYYIPKSNTYMLFRGCRLTELISSFFSISDNESSKFIQFWFGDKHNLQKIGDLEKFILTPKTI